MPNNQPNVVLVLTDQQQGAYMSCAGNPYVNTPAMDRLASEGTRFDRAFCPTPQCSPSRASLLTGLYPHAHQVRGNIPDTSFGPPQLPVELPSLGSLLEESGYRGAYFGKWHLGKPNDPASNPLSYGFEHYIPKNAPSELGSEEGLAAQAGEYIRNYHDERPLLLVASFNDPHGVYALPKVTLPLNHQGIDLPASFVDDLSKKPSAQRVYRDEDQPAALPLDEETARRYLAWYAYMVERADGYLARILSAIDARPDLVENTVVIFLSDHGDLATAHGLPFKGPAMYEELVRVPLIIRGPGLAANQVRGEMVSLMDILPTVCDLAGVGRPDHLPGRSLVPLLRGDTVPWRDSVILEYHGKQRWTCPIRMIRTADHKLSIYSTGERELYDLRVDPDEMSNLAGSPEYAEIEKSLTRRLRRWMAEQGDDFPSLMATDRQGSPSQ